MTRFAKNRFPSAIKLKYTIASSKTSRDNLMILPETHNVYTFYVIRYDAILMALNYADILKL